MSTPELTEVIRGFGHPNVQATHHSTVEFTRETELSRNGDCILVVATDKALSNLGAEFKAALQKPHAKLAIKIEVDNVCDEIHAQGSPKLALSHPQEMVVRKSNFASDRTLGIYADKAAKDLSRALVEKLKNPKQQAKITLTVNC
ncbi:MAG: DUF371 domain-containing protein [Candidatus Bathyarchaeota archaeon]|nr:DUF371 domain-containing protein [Candidatus Bathyarchaeota archaeon]